MEAIFVQAQGRKDFWNPCTLVLIWEYSARAIQWIPTWQGLDGFQKSLRPCALDKVGLALERLDIKFKLRLSINGLTIPILPSVRIRFFYKWLLLSNMTEPIRGESVNDLIYACLNLYPPFVGVFQPLCCWWLIWPIQNDAKKLKLIETLAHGYSSESTQRELSDE